MSFKFIFKAGGGKCLSTHTQALYSVLQFFSYLVFQYYLTLPYTSNSLIFIGKY